MNKHAGYATKAELITGGLEGHQAAAHVHLSTDIQQCISSLQN